MELKRDPKVNVAGIFKIVSSEDTKRRAADIKQDDARHKRDEATKLSDAKVARGNKEVEHELFERAIFMWSAVALLAAITATCVATICLSSDAGLKKEALDLIKTFGLAALSFLIGRGSGKTRATRKS